MAKQSGEAFTTLVGALRRHFDNGGENPISAVNLQEYLVNIAHNDLYKETSEVHWAEAPEAPVAALRAPQLAEVLAQHEHKLKSRARARRRWSTPRMMGRRSEQGRMARRG